MPLRYLVGACTGSAGGRNAKACQLRHYYRRVNRIWTRCPFYTGRGSVPSYPTLGIVTHVHAAEQGIGFQGYFDPLDLTTVRSIVEGGAELGLDRV